MRTPKTQFVKVRLFDIADSQIEGLGRIDAVELKLYIVHTQAAIDSPFLKVIKDHHMQYALI